MPLSSAVLDHVAVAVGDLPAARAVWRDMGGVDVAGGGDGVFATEQLRMGNGGKVELIAPHPRARGGSFVDAFLARFGSGVVHHITLKVPAPHAAAVATLQADGFDVVDVSQPVPEWHEGFLRPSQVGGVIVQVAWAEGDDADFARRTGRPAPLPPDPGAPGLAAVRLRHPDLDRAAWVWTALGGDVQPRSGAVQPHDGSVQPRGGAPGGHGEGLVVRFPSSPIAVEVVAGEKAGPVGLVLDGLDDDREPTDTVPRLLTV